MFPLEIILDILQFNCSNSKNFYEYSLLSKKIYTEIRKYKNITYNIQFKVKNQKYFIENINNINKDYWIKNLNISYCKQITDKAFENLKGIHTLDIRGCTQITDKAYE